MINTYSICIMQWVKYEVNGQHIKYILGKDLIEYFH